MSASSQAVTSRGVKDQSYKRGYVACVGCRARKVRCVLGAKPPCAKCSREHRECIFQAARKSGKQREVPKWARGAGNSRNLQAEHGRAGEDNDGARETVHTAETRWSNRDTNTPRHSHRDVETPGSDHPSFSGRVMSTILARPSDALDVLFDAARLQQPQAPGRPSLLRATEQTLQSLASPGGDSTRSNIVAESGLVAVSGLSQPSDDVLDLWDKCRFVRQGWFTAQEAVTYLDLLYQYLAPLSPVLTDIYRDHLNHERLVVEEPMLCCTLLMISSRFFVLPGAGGVSRSHFIHHRLWQYCELLIRRIMFGQEKHSTAKTRVVGSIESLILISDWHPRSVHFPAETEGWDGELISPAYDRHNRIQTDGDVPLIRWREDVFEPAKRSERISWMLLGAAVSLAYELGIFTDDSTAAGVASSVPGHNVRVSRARRLLYIYVTQMAVRMGCSSLLPDSAFFSPSALTQRDVEPIDRQWESYMDLWVELTRLMKTASAMFFQSMPHIQQQLLSGHYSILLQHFGPSLTRWHEQFITRSPNIPEGLRPLVLIEYHYLKTYTSALAIQAVVQRAISRGVNRLGEPNKENLDSCVMPHDHDFIRDVISSSERVLEIATSMASEGRLRYAPLRTLICVTSSSVFLLKAISLGARIADLQKSLRTLDSCIAALRVSGTDDMDFSLRYATLIEKYVSRFRATFIIPDRSIFATVSGDTLPQGPALASEDLGSGTSYEPFSCGPQFQDRSSDNPSGGQLQCAVGDDWWARPFDPSIAPFSSTGEDVSLGLELDSLDFLWNLPNVNGE